MPQYPRCYSILECYSTVLLQYIGMLQCQRFFSCAMAPRHTKLVAYERELIGLVQAVKHWRAYLWGARLW
jgi:hypothetical protein